ncbi:MAG: TldD/PmbA family protein [Anaerolineae bacterium]|nr:TldD/PmbA family protein [Anaerolineae bacterium]
MDYMQLAKDIVARIAEKGVEGEALIIDSQETHMQVNQGEVSQLMQSGSRGVGIRVIDGGRVGYAYTSNFAPDSIEKTTRAAIELAQVATPDANRVIPDPSPVSEEDLEIWDAELATMPIERKIDFLKRVERAALAYDPRVVLVPWCEYEDNVAVRYLANSKGFAGSYGKTTASCFLFAVAADGDQRAESFDLGASIFFHELDPEQIGQLAAKRSLSMLGGTSVPTQNCPVVFDALVAAELLATLSFALSGEQILKKRSFLIDQIGKEIASDKFSLVDNARLKRGLGSRPFDDEGVPTSATRLIDEGMFQAALYDTYAAKRAGARSTGNASRGSHRQLSTVGVSNLYLQPGNKSVDELIAGVDQGLYVTRIMQTGGVNPVTGDCSMGAYGTWIENGKLTKAVAGITVATTLQALLQNVSDVASDIRAVPFGGVINVPTIRVENVTVGGTPQA